MPHIKDLEKEVELKFYSGVSPKQFCWKCGTRLKRSQYFSGHYNEENGEKNIHTVLFCPSMFGVFHGETRFDELGNEIIELYPS